MTGMKFGAVAVGLGFVVAASSLVGCRTDPIAGERSYATRAYLDGDYERALELNKRILDRYPQSNEARYDAGRALVKLGRPSEAVIEFEVAHELEPENMTYLEALLDAEYLAGRYDRISSRLKKRLNARADHRDALLLGKYHERVGAADDALVAYRQAVIMADGREIDEQIETRVKLSDFYGRVGDRDAQLEQLRYALWFDIADEIVRERLEAIGVTPGPDLALDPRTDPLVRVVDGASG